jgi:hypothetical protein
MPPCTRKELNLMNTSYRPIERYAIETAQYDADRLFVETGIWYKVIEASEGVFIAVPVDDAPPKTNEPQQTNHIKILDDDADYFELDLLQYVEDTHIMKRLAIAVANAAQMPVSSVFLAGLGIFSAVAVRNYVVAYQHTDDIPVGLFIEIEQPSGSGKTRCLTGFQKPFFEAYEMRCKEWKCKIDELEKDLAQAEGDESREIEKTLKHLKKNPPPQPFITNATPESLEPHLMRSGGWFALASSEQGAINSILGKSYNDSGRANNNDLMLNGFDGGYVASSRIGREGYCGEVRGAFIVFAQHGSVETMIKSSNGIGLAERMIFAVEQHYLGRRNHFQNTAIPYELLEEYRATCECLEYVCHSHTGEKLAALKISDCGHQKITEFKQSIESHQADGGKYSHDYLRGAASKLNMQIMKIAAILHLSDSVIALHENLIADEWVDSAIGIVSELFEGSVRLCTAKGFIGEKAEFEALINYLSKDGGKAKTGTEITNSLRSTNPFKNYSGNKRSIVTQALKRAVAQGLVVEIYGNSKTPTYKLA